MKKQIEEMAKDLYGHICGKEKCQECKYNGDSEILEPYCPDYLRAKHLIEKGYRKITENVVVLTKEEYKSLIYWEGRFDELIKLATETTRKETAEKFAERLKEKLGEFFDDNEDNDGKISKAICLIDVIGVVAKDGEVISLGLIDEICKEITEGENIEPSE